MSSRIDLRIDFAFKTLFGTHGNKDAPHNDWNHLSDISKLELRQIHCTFTALYLFLTLIQLPFRDELKEPLPNR
ncbi:hypothetical protein SAMN04487909_1804 [Aneurinibacillus migulanus]|uniref:Uncharacterized protein n=1 Tax=Aneurinibacillus migulanus TaxID=47500 RepID=A0A1G9D5J3_ANEMI|nr:hypothetical protein SAMN04487909_1804 [Aneurinibacillus migulanus]